MLQLCNWLLCNVTGAAAIPTVGDECSSLPHCRGGVDGQRCPTGQTRGDLYSQVRH